MDFGKYASENAGKKGSSKTYIAFETEDEGYQLVHSVRAGMGTENFKTFITDVLKNSEAVIDLLSEE